MKPADSELINQAVSAFNARNRDHAADLVGRLVQQNPAIGATWGSVSRLAATLGEASLAIKAARNHARHEPNSMAVQLALGQTLAQEGRLAEAEALASTLIVRAPKDGAAWHFRGVCRTQLGHSDEAIADFRTAIDHLGVSPGAAWAWLALSAEKTFTADDPDLTAMQELLRELTSRTQAEDAVAALGYALGKAHDDRREEDLAFEQWRNAALVRARQKPHPDAGYAFAQQVVSECNSAFQKALPGRGAASSRPIFVIGLPRSGTTLVEQILVSHSAVIDGAELNLFRTAAMPIDGFSPTKIRAYADRTGAEGFEAIGHTYLHLLDERFGSEGRIVDKTLNHSRFTGLIHHTLPDAPIIWVRRDPAATAWSCFHTWFARGIDWSWTFDDIAAHFCAEDLLYQHWSDLLGDAVLTVPYDALVSDPEPWLERILAHAGLPFEAGVRDFHKAKRAVATASFAQVRQPLHTRAKDEWRRYERHMAPFFENYGVD